MIIKKELLFSITKKDFYVEYFSGTGAGGQHRNKHQNCVRLHHLESRAIGTGQSSRKRSSNMREAISSLLKSPRFKIWHSAKVQEILTGKSLDEKIEDMMHPNNLKVEMNKDGKWVAYNVGE